MIKGYKKIINDTLLQYFDEILSNKTHSRAKKAIESMKYTTCLKGKRLRGILCLEACKIVSGDYFPAIPSACALEMLHAQSLIHDDLPSMDNDDLRRGMPSNHKVYGENIAILAGDALISLGGEIILEKTPKTVPLISILNAEKEYLHAAGIFGIVGGQTADLEAEKMSSPDLELLNYIQNYKTGALFSASCFIGAIIGGADQNVINSFAEFTENFGLAFQMADDILDVTSNSDIMGKTTGKDLKENKMTYIKQFGLDGAKEKLEIQINKTYDILKNKNIESEIFLEILNSIKI